MKLLLYGDAAVPGTGGWCYAETLEEMGHAVVRTSEEHLLEHYRRLMWRGARKLLGRPLEQHRRRHAQALVELVKRESPEIVVIFKGIQISKHDVAAMRALGCWVVIISHDDFFSSNPTNWSPVQRAALPHYDFVFVTREVNIGEVAPLNPHVEIFPFAYYPRIHRPIEIPTHERAIWSTDVAFVGTWEADRCALMENLVQCVPARYAIWGHLWERVSRRSPLRPFIRGRGVIMEDMAKAIGGAQICLGFLRKKNRDDYTQRTFEIPACGGLLLAERTARHQSIYREGIEAEFFDPARPEELVEKVRQLLAEPNKRMAIRQAGHAALLRRADTYRDRMARLLQIYADQRG